ncbi:hypothetical protein Ciccas_006218 [Cichlidogyrus casuarinus]|uniref:Uncharacterized protein n=1 Tax=Cichlidogyrus casuarinus TaxID=1844966 RepID=A0ABD2Q6R4_9PLAT
MHWLQKQSLSMDESGTPIMTPRVDRIYEEEFGLPDSPLSPRNIYNYNHVRRQVMEADSPRILPHTPGIKRLYPKKEWSSGFSTPSELSRISQTEERVTHAISYLINRHVGNSAPLADFDTPFASASSKRYVPPSPLSQDLF